MFNDRVLLLRLYSPSTVFFLLVSSIISDIFLFSIFMLLTINGNIHAHETIYISTLYVLTILFLCSEPNSHSHHTLTKKTQQANKHQDRCGSDNDENGK